VSNGSSTWDDLVAELERRLAAESRMASALVELERHPGYRLLETITPTGVTAQRWTTARAAAAGLWQDFMSYRSVLAGADALRGRRARPAERERAELHRLLREPCIEVGRTVVQRRLTGTVEDVEMISLAQLATRMETAYADVDQLVMTCDALHSAYLAGLGPLLERMHAVRAQAAGLAVGSGPPPEAAAIAALTSRLAVLEGAATDPLALAADAPVDVLAALDADIAALAARLALVAALRDGWDLRLAEIADALAELDALHADERQVRARARGVILGHGLVEPPDATRMLRDRLTGLAAPIGWSARARRLDELRAAIDTAANAVRSTREQASGLLDRRAELRGRFEAFRAKAGRLGHAEHPEIMRLGRDIEDLLWARPCDLAAATRALNAYQRTLTGLGVGRPT
jgi:hypothetical protein